MGLHLPGPPAIEPGGAPGGLVFHLYDDRDQLVASDRVTFPRWEPSEAMVEAANREMLVLVVYDGDTGMRWSDEDFQQAGFHSGDRLV